MKCIINIGKQRARVWAITSSVYCALLVSPSSVFSQTSLTLRDYISQALSTHREATEIYFTRELDPIEVKGEALEELRKHISDFDGWPGQTNHYYGVFLDAPSFLLQDLNEPTLRPQPYSQNGEHGTGHGRYLGRPWSVSRNHLYWDLPPDRGSTGSVDATVPAFLMITSALTFAVDGTQGRGTMISSNLLTFTSHFGGHLSGHFEFDADGVPLRLVYTNDNIPGHFVKEVTYLRSAEQDGFPLHMTVSKVAEDGTHTKVSRTTVHRVNHIPIALVNEKLDPASLIVASNLVINVWSNRNLHVVSNGVLVAVGLPIKPSGTTSSAYYIIVILIVLSPAIALLGRRVVKHNH